MRTDGLNVEKAIAPFKMAIGEVAFPKIVNDIRSLLGKVDKDGTVKNGEWKASAGFKLRRNSGETLPLPANNPATIILLFGMRLQEIAGNAEIEVEASIPAQCKAWIVEHSRKAVEPVKA